MEGNTPETVKVRDPFGELYYVDVNEHTEKKNGLTYLSWAWAWGEVRKRYPDANYCIVRNDDNMSYWRDPISGFLEVRTIVMIGNEQHEMWLPIMDGSNTPLKFEPYEVTTRNGKRTVQAATMFDINKSLMRCLAKNLAMFGLGLYIYAGEDMPEEEADPEREALEGARAQVIDFIQKYKSGHTKEEVLALANIVKRDLGTVKVSEVNDIEKLNVLLDKLAELE